MIDWDTFVHAAVQAWENLYIQWLKKENRILIIFYGDLLHGSLQTLLTDIGNFLGIAYTKKRMRCLLKHREGLNAIRRKPNCHPNDLFIRGHGISTCSNIKQKINQTKCNVHQLYSSKESCTLEIYNKKHIRWINSAIRKVKHSIAVRGIIWPGSFQYENTQVIINVCSIKQ